MNNPNNMLIIESRSNYAFQLRGKNLSFSEIRNTSTAFFTSLPEDVRNELYNNMCHGTVKLDCEPELNAYMYAFGAMHNAKLRDAFSHLSTHFFDEKEIDIIDYGCGQAMGCISYADCLRENNHTQNVRRITLIEPSEIALARAALHSSLLFPNAEIVTINKGFDDLTASDIEVDTNIPTLHIFSNVLDMGSTPNYNGVFNLETFSNLVLEISKGYNEYVITEPLFSDSRRDEQVDIFIRSLGLNVYYEKKCNTGEFFTGKDWTCVVKCGCIGYYDSNIFVLHKDSWSLKDFRDLHGPLHVLTYADYNELVIEAAFYDETDGLDMSNYTYAKFSKLHGCLSIQTILKNKDNVTIYQRKNIKGEEYYELELNCKDGISLAEFIKIYGKTRLGKLGEQNTAQGEGPVVYINESNEINDLFLRHRNLYKELFADTIRKNSDKIKIYQRVDVNGDKYFELVFNINFIPNNEIWYETTNDTAIDVKYYNPNNNDGLNIISNTYKKGLGIIKFNGEVTKLRRGIFSRSWLKKVYLPSNLNIIGDGAFESCHRLEHITIPKGVTTISDEAFEFCGLRDITLPKGVTMIGRAAFKHCRDLHSIIIPDSVTVIGEKAFNECSSLNTVTIPNSVVTIENSVFYECTSLCSVVISEGVTTIGNWTFCDCKKLTSVIIPNSITKIGESVFWCCESLTTVILPDSLDIIDDGAFMCCYGLKEIKIPDSVTSIGPRAFSCCRNLQSIIIHDNVSQIGHAAFNDCNGLQRVVIGKGLTYIGSDAFKGCTGELFVKCIMPHSQFHPYGPFHGSEFKKVVIDNCVNVIGDWAFDSCYYLKDVIIPEGATKIGAMSFYYCKSLTDITLPNSLTSIESYAFTDCSSLTSITIPDNVTNIAECAFIRCDNLKEFKGKFSHDNGVCLNINNELNAFAFGSGITVYTIPNDIISIGDYAFYYYECLTNITIPTCITRVGKSAFNHCKNLRIVNCKPIEPPVCCEFAFDDCDDNLKIYVPLGSEERYKATDGWKRYADKIIGYNYES